MASSKAYFDVTAGIFVPGKKWSTFVPGKMKNAHEDLAVHAS
jgi:hypothetical protein